MQKLRIKRQSNCTQLGTVNLGHPVIGRPLIQSICKSKQIKDPKLGQFKVVRENSGYGVQCTLPIYLPFSNFSKSVGPRPWRVTTLSIFFEPVSIYLELSLILFATFLQFLMAILEAKKKFSKKIYKTFLRLLKSVNNKHTLLELMSRRNVHHHPPQERLHSGRETWLSVTEKASALSKMQSPSKKNKKKQKAR